MPSVGFCEYHHLQMRRSQGKRKNNKLSPTAKHKRWPPARKLRQGRVRGQLLGDGRTRTKQKVGEKLEDADLEVTRDLPNGVMAISPGTAMGLANASPSVDLKLGSDYGFLLGRRFRSKNAERVPLATVQKLPFFRSMGGRRTRLCHPCSAREKKVVGKIRCFSCQEFFCTTCIETWHSELSEFHVNNACPVCCGCYSCINCNSRRDKDGGFKKLVFHQNKFCTTSYAYHLICELFPPAKHINGEQITELEAEAKNQGRKLADVLVKVPKYCDNKQINCNNCRTKINMFFRSCSVCTYRFCLSCCQKIRVGSLTTGGTNIHDHSKGRQGYYIDEAISGKKVGLSSRKHINTSALCCSVVLHDWKINTEGSISCPPKELGAWGFLLIERTLLG